MKNPHVILSTEEPLIIGPFPDQDGATFFGKAWQDKNKDDPRWQVVDLKASELLIEELYITASDAVNQLLDWSGKTDHFILFSASWHSDIAGHLWTGLARDLPHALLLAIIDSTPVDVWPDGSVPDPDRENSSLLMAIRGVYSKDELREIVIILAGEGELPRNTEINPDEILRINVEILRINVEDLHPADSVQGSQDEIAAAGGLEAEFNTESINDR